MSFFDDVVFGLIQLAVEAGEREKQKEDIKKLTLKEAEQMRNGAFASVVNSKNNVVNIMYELASEELYILKSFDALVKAIDKIHNIPFNDDWAPELQNYDRDKLMKYVNGADKLIKGFKGSNEIRLGGLAILGVASYAEKFADSQITEKSFSKDFGVWTHYDKDRLYYDKGETSNNPDTAMLNAMEKQADSEKIRLYLDKISNIAKQYKDALDSIDNDYKSSLSEVYYIIYNNKKEDWDELQTYERGKIKKSIILADLLLKMCQVKITDSYEVEKAINNAEGVMRRVLKY